MNSRDKAFSPSDLEPPASPTSSTQEGEDTDFFEEDMEKDDEDLFCMTNEDLEHTRIHVSQSLVHIFPTECITEQLDGEINDGDYIPSDELLSDTNSSDEEGKRPCPVFNEKTDFGKHIELSIGMQFRNHKFFRKALVEFAIVKGFDFDYINNKRLRISAQCTNEDCSWKITASENVDKNGGVCFEIKSMTPHKNCSRDYSGSKISAKYLAEHYLEAFRDNPKWDIEAFRKHVTREFEADVSYRKCLRAKNIALTIIDGSVGEQYKLLKDYCGAIKKYNPGSSVFLTTVEGHFQRIYICLEACKRGFLAGCRPIISLDACHLKGAYNGQIHSAVGSDGNDNMFPIAYAICESESKATWSWFIHNLLSDIGNERANGWCFISDQQKGLQEALKELSPHLEHRFCVRHLYANFRKIFKGRQLKDAMWACARSTTPSQFKKAMEYVKQLDNDAYTYLSKMDPAVWSKHGFSYFVKSDALCSNISECFNSFIKVARDQPIITCLETIRKLLMKRFYGMRTGIENYGGDICPRIWKKVENNIRDSMHCNVTYGGGPSFEVEHTIHGNFIANVHTRSCTCRLWELTGIPCIHACAAIRHMRGNPTDYVHQSYKKSEFMKIYEPYILPLPGPSEWPQQDDDHVLPPLYKRQAGRPRRRRIREVGEPVNPYRKRKGGSLLKCGRCGNAGHNARRCKGDITDQKRAEQSKKDAARSARNRNKKKNASIEGASASIDIGVRNARDKIKKAIVKRTKKRPIPITLRESQVSTCDQPTRDWHTEYDIVGNVVPYERPICNGPLQISTRGGQAMFTRDSSSSSSIVRQYENNVQEN